MASSAICTASSSPSAGRGVEVKHREEELLQRAGVLDQVGQVVQRGPEPPALDAPEDDVVGRHGRDQLQQQQAGLPDVRGPPLVRHAAAHLGGVELAVGRRKDGKEICNCCRN